MAVLRRRTPDSRILELARQLAEDYHAIPLPVVARVVSDAAIVVIGADGHWQGRLEGLPAVLSVIEALSREELDATGGSVTRAPADRAPRATRPSGPRLGAA
jgi:hypothetical protein